MKSREFGKVVTYNGTYAFLRPHGADRDVFAHSSQLPDGGVHTGDKDSFDVAPDPFKPGRMMAMNVTFADEKGLFGGAEETSGGALAEGLNKLLGNRQEGETQP
jgi:cold shock CspA family protein